VTAPRTPSKADLTEGQRRLLEAELAEAPVERPAPRLAAHRLVRHVASRLESCPRIDSIVVLASLRQRFAHGGEGMSSEAREAADLYQRFVRSGGGTSQLAWQRHGDLHPDEGWPSVGRLRALLGGPRKKWSLVAVNSQVALDPDLSAVRLVAAGSPFTREQWLAAIALWAESVPTGPLRAKECEEWLRRHADDPDIDIRLPRSLRLQRLGGWQGVLDVLGLGHRSSANIRRTRYAAVVESSCEGLGSKAWAPLRAASSWTCYWPRFAPGSSASLTSHRCGPGRPSFSQA